MPARTQLFFSEFYHGSSGTSLCLNVLNSLSCLYICLYSTANKMEVIFISQYAQLMYYRTVTSNGLLKTRFHLFFSRFSCCQVYFDSIGVYGSFGRGQLCIFKLSPPSVFSLFGVCSFHYLEDKKGWSVITWIRWLGIYSALDNT